ncbi:hypothetical protein INS49_004674 [Diaporthe citri]|uniref:uncharacterized protein n=1 Tax=Diaporthe citri TaxID=83186 RepID=UPI001C80A7A9|nr:uncharacterized protein INS49_004674 [Diaporthe citri]KAG6354656.1 hypothetical protein INS49_004674 [Diaporthe citri]
MESSTKFRGGTWQRYKLGQAQFTKWLRQTADKFTSATSTTGGVASSSSPHKKALKAASKAAIDSDVVVHWRELETMASNIVELAKPEDIPSAPVNILRDVIGLRKKSARFFRRSTEDDNESAREKNATHEHVIKVLERVLGKFEALMAKGTKSADARSSDRIKMDLADLNNMFENLELQTSPADDDVASDIENQPESSVPTRKTTKKSKKGGKKLQKGGKPKKQQKPQSQPQEPRDAFWLDGSEFDLDYDDGDKEFDYYMMMYCFFEDFNIIRSYICERWCDYFYDRSISLNTLAVITNAAFELFHQMEHHLLLDMQRMGTRGRTFGSYEFMMMGLFTESGLEHVDYDSYRNLSKEDSDARMWTDEWDWLASPAFVAIRGILSHILPGKTPMMRKADKTPPTYGVTNTDDLARFNETCINELLFDVVCVKALKTKGLAPALLPAESELLLGFQDALRNNNFTSAFIFSVQLYCDIRYILEDRVSHPFEQLQKTTQQFDQGFDLVYTRAVGPRSSLRWELRQRRKEFDRFILSDVVLEDKLPRYIIAGLDREDLDDFFLLKHEPVWAGLLDLRVRLVTNELGHEFVHLSFIVEAAAYLYAAARAASKQFSEQQEFPVWDHMEMFLDTYVDDSPFKRGILDGGDDPVKIIKNFKAIMPANVLVPKPDNCPLDDGSDRTPDFKQAVRVRQLLSKRYTSSDRENMFFMEYMQGLIRERLEHEVENIESEEDLSTVLQDISANKFGGQPHSQGVLPKERRELARERIKLKQMQHKRKAMLAQLSPIQQIHILENIVEEQVEDLLALDFMTLFDMSWVVLYFVARNQRRSMRDKCGFTTSSIASFETAANLPLIIGDHLTAKPARNAKLLWNLAQDVRGILEKPEGAEALFGLPDDEFAELIEDRAPLGRQ